MMENVESNDSFFLTDAISGLLLEMVDLESDITSQVLADTKDAVLALSELLTSAEITNSALDSLQKLLPLVPEEKQGEFNKIVAPEEGKKKILTPENVIALLSLIVSIISMINSFKPQDPQILSDDSKQFFHDEFSRIVAAVEEKACPECGFLELYQTQCLLDNIKECDEMPGKEIDIINDFVEPDRQDENASAQQPHQDGQE